VGMVLEGVYWEQATGPGVGVGVGVGIDPWVPYICSSRASVAFVVGLPLTVTLAYRACTVRGWMIQSLRKAF
jgi:hypothetical protein